MAKIKCVHPSTNLARFWLIQGGLYPLVLERYRVPFAVIHYSQVAQLAQ